MRGPGVLVAAVALAGGLVLGAPAASTADEPYDNGAEGRPTR